MTKTPQFDAALDEIFATLKPHERACGTCQKAFIIESADIVFLKLLRVSPPKTCPRCRRIRRLAHLMRAPKFFRRSCNVPGHTEQVVSVYPPDSPYTTYDFAYWYSDEWDPTQFSAEFKEGAYLPQIAEFLNSVPRPPLDRDPNGINCEYTLGGTRGKNNYICAWSWHAEDSSYCLDTRYNKEFVDCITSSGGELGYELVGCIDCAHSIYLLDCNQCLESSFLYDCKNCTSCFMSANLRNRHYVFRGQQLSKEEYQHELSKIDFGSRTHIQILKRELEEISNQAMHRSLNTVSCELTVGEFSEECRDAYFVFLAKKLEHCRFVEIADTTRDSSDVTSCANNDLQYETLVSVRGSNNKFSLYIRDCSDMEYSLQCNNCESCFGCAGLKNKRFHILNRPYAEEEYWKKVDEIKTSMLVREEYGEMFSLSLGLMPYQSSIAQKEFPLVKDQASKRGISWYTEPDIQIPSGARILQPEDVPDNIRDVPDEVLNSVLICEETRKPFRLVPNELQFYRRMNLPVPVRHPWIRMMDRSKYERPLELYLFKCSACQEDSWSSYSPDKQAQLNILCQKCYLREIT